MKEERFNLISKLFNLNKNLDIIEKGLNKFDWDYTWKTLVLTSDNIIILLTYYLNNKLDYDYLIKWANIIELRDEIDYEEGYEEVISEIINILSSPEINWKLNNIEIKKYIKELRKNNF